MPEFLKLSLPADALKLFLRTLQDVEPGSEIVETTHALGRTMAQDLHAPHPLPEFPRSTVDGYAVRASDTFGVSTTVPGYLTLVGEVLMGNTPDLTLLPGTCALIHTGGRLPGGADAVVMLEYTQRIDKGVTGTRSTEILIEIEISRAVAEGENTLRVGEDVVENQIILSTGKQIRPGDVGGCMALGLTRLRVARKPKIGIISSGDELVQPDNTPQPGEIRDINSYSLAALIDHSGGEPVMFGIVPDNISALKEIAERALKRCDAVVVTAGSSVSTRDITAEVIGTLGSPGVLVHGINIKPGKPTILAVCAGKAVIGLPGNPVSALVVARLFLVPVIEKLLRRKGRRPVNSIRGRMQVNVPSVAGREDWILVRLRQPEEREVQLHKDELWIAEPIFGKSNLIFSYSSADGLVRIPAEATGIGAGEIVEIELI